MRKRFRTVAIAAAMAALFSMPGTSEAQFSFNIGGGKSGNSFGMSFGQGGKSGGLQFGSPNNMGGQRGHNYSRPGSGLNSSRPGSNFLSRPGSGNFDRPGNGLVSGGPSGWGSLPYQGGRAGFGTNPGGGGWAGLTPGRSNWSNSTPSYARSYSAPTSNAYAYSAPAATAPRPPAEPILILNPDYTGTPVHYKVNNYAYIMDAGQNQQLPGTSTWTIDYHRGGNYGRQKYTLDPGKTYRFTPTQSGWSLYAVNPPVPPVPGLSSLGN